MQRQGPNLRSSSPDLLYVIWGLFYEFKIDLTRRRHKSFWISGLEDVGDRLKCLVRRNVDDNILRGAFDMHLWWTWRNYCWSEQWKTSSNTLHTSDIFYWWMKFSINYIFIEEANIIHTWPIALTKVYN